MQKVLAALALATPLLSYAALPDVHTSTLDLTSIYDNPDSSWPNNPATLHVLSNQGGAVTVTTDAWQTLHNDEAGDTVPNVTEYGLSMTLAPAAGYVITGYSISASVSGILKVPVKPPEANSSWVPGSANNTAAIYLPDGKGGLVFKEINDVTASTLFESSVQGLSIDHATKLDFTTFTGAYASYGRWSDWGEMGEEHKIAGYSKIIMSNPSLTIYTALAPVPEPETWGMLLAGIALLGVAKRRSKR